MESLVDQSMIDLLKACSLLPYPDIVDIESKFYRFGVKNRQKTLILDMNETLLHSKFHNYNRHSNENVELGLQTLGGV